MESPGTDGTGSSSSRFDPAQRLSPTAFEQNATMKDTSVHEDPGLLRVGVSRNEISSSFGTPTKSATKAARNKTFTSSIRTGQSS